MPDRHLAPDVRPHAEAMLRAALRVTRDPLTVALAGLTVSAAYCARLADTSEVEWLEDLAEDYALRRHLLAGTWAPSSARSLATLTERPARFLDTCEALNDAGADAALTGIVMCAVSLVIAGRAVVSTPTTGEEMLAAGRLVWMRWRQWWVPPGEEKAA